MKFAPLVAKPRPPSKKPVNVYPQLGTSFSAASISARSPSSLPLGSHHGNFEVGAADHPLEHEADAIADWVMRVPADTPNTIDADTSDVPREREIDEATTQDQYDGDETFVDQPSLQAAGGASPPNGSGTVAHRKYTSGETKDVVWTRASYDAGDASDHVDPGVGPHGALMSDGFTNRVHSYLRTGGRPLSDATRGFLETRLGVGLGHVRVHADAGVGLLARPINARAFTLGHDIFFAPGELRPHTSSGMRLLVHEVAHTLQHGHLGAVRRKVPGLGKAQAEQFVAERDSMEIEFEQEAFDASAQTFDKYGNLTWGKGMGREFKDGAEAFLGVDVDIDDTTLKITRNEEKIASNRSAFLNTFSTPKQLTQAIVTSGTDTAPEQQLPVDRTYAAAVFDAAVDLVTLSEDVDVSVSSLITGAAKTLPYEGKDIEVNPDVVNTSLVDSSSASSYDGFWIVLHELFHRAPKHIYQALTTAQNESSLLKGSDLTASFVDDKWAVEDDEATWRADPDGAGELGTIESFFNVLRTGFRLPIRRAYGTVSSKGTFIPFGADSKRGMLRPNDSGWWNTHVEVNKMVESAYGNRVDEVWTDRLRSAELTIRTPEGWLDLFPDTGAITGRKFAPVMRSADGDATAQMIGTWTVDDTATIASAGMAAERWPQYEFGTIAVTLTTPGHVYNGEGTLHCPDPFYENKVENGLPYFRDASTLSGVVTLEEAAMLKTTTCDWGLVLGLPDKWAGPNMPQ